MQYTTETLDGMTVAQLEELVQRAKASLTAAKQREEQSAWIAFAPNDLAWQARVHRDTGRVEEKFLDEHWKETPTSSAHVRRIVSDLGPNRPRAMRMIARALTALADAQSK